MVHKKSNEGENGSCTLSARFLDWESGLIMSVEDAIANCEKVTTCNLKCTCRLREAYYYYLNEQYKKMKELTL
jgi:hypothetical protein